MNNSLGSIKSLLNTINGEVLQKPKETSKLIVPAALYTIQNNLLFLALSNLDAATYQVKLRIELLLLYQTMINQILLGHLPTQDINHCGIFSFNVA